MQNTVFGIATILVAAFVIYKISLEILVQGFTIGNGVFLLVALAIAVRGILRIFNRRS